jgi:hypothetical protein
MLSDDRVERLKRPSEDPFDPSALFLVSELVLPLLLMQGVPLALQTALHLAQGEPPLVELSATLPQSTILEPPVFLRPQEPLQEFASHGSERQEPEDACIPDRTPEIRHAIENSPI